MIEMPLVVLVLVGLGTVVAGLEMQTTYLKTYQPTNFHGFGATLRQQWGSAAGGLVLPGKAPALTRAIVFADLASWLIARAASRYSTGSATST